MSGTATATARATRTGVVLVVVSAAAFGAMAIFARRAYDDGAGVTGVLALRFALAAAVLLVVVRARGLALPRGRLLVALVLLGGLGYVGQSLSYFTALTLAPAGLVALLLYLYPGFVTVLSVALGRERLTRARGFALLLATAGTALTVGGGAGGDRPVALLGVLLGVVSAAVYAVYIVLSERTTAAAGPLPSTAVITASAAVAVGVPALVTGSPVPSSPGGWAAVAAMALVSTVVAIVAFFAGLARLGPTSTATLSTLEPVVTVTLAALVLGEAVGPLQAAGGALVLAAVLVLVRTAPARAQ